MYAEPRVSMYNPEFVAEVNRKRKAQEAKPRRQAPKVSKQERAERKEREERRLAEYAERKAARKAADLQRKQQAREAAALAKAMAPERIERIIQRMCKACGVSREEMFSKSRKRNALMARQGVYYLAYRYAIKSFPHIGRHIGVHHTSVIDGYVSYPKRRRAMRLRRVNGDK